VEFFLVQLLNGISYGLMLFMLASGLTLVFSLMGVLNFAHASFYMLGAYFAYQVSTKIGFWPALVLAPAICGLVGALIEMYALRRVHKNGHIAELLFTFGLAFIIEKGVQMAWGLLPVPYRVPPVLDAPLFTIYGSNFHAYRGFMLLISALMFVAIWLLLTRTRIGLVIQAALSHPQTVEALGHNVPRVFMLVFGGGAALAGLAGVIGGNAFVTEPGMAALVGPIVFVIVVVGGMGSLAGAFVASLLIGIMQTFSVSLDWSLAGLFSQLGRNVTSQTPLAAIVALPASSFSATALNDFTFGSCELVTGSKSTGPTSPFGVWASALAHNSTSAFDRCCAFAALLSMMNAPPPSPLPFAARA